mmetsp:Transcript_10128/g.19549  ORF Transcript_10128/g.19549 Transcript_10128/m.19549 type:complete len:232 (-) Transcript_10128:652-1347(-)
MPLPHPQCLLWQLWKGPVKMAGFVQAVAHSCCSSFQVGIPPLAAPPCRVPVSPLRALLQQLWMSLVAPMNVAKRLSGQLMGQLLWRLLLLLQQLLPLPLSPSRPRPRQTPQPRRRQLPPRRPGRPRKRVASPESAEDLCSLCAASEQSSVWKYANRCCCGGLPPLQHLPAPPHLHLTLQAALLVGSGADVAAVPLSPRDCFGLQMVLTMTSQRFAWSNELSAMTALLMLPQ